MGNTIKSRDVRKAWDAGVLRVIDPAGYVRPWADLNWTQKAAVIFDQTLKVGGIALALGMIARMVSKTAWGQTQLKKLATLDENKMGRKVYNVLGLKGWVSQ